MYGKGFAVVAEEIQKLAEQTRKAVDNIGTIVTASVEDIGRAVKVMEQSAELTETGMESMSEVGSSTASITSSNEKMTKQIVEMDHTVENIWSQSDEVAEWKAQKPRSATNSVPYITVSVKRD